MSIQGSIYLITAVVKPTSNGVELMKTFDKIKIHFEDYSNWTKVRHRFKVTGEAKAVAIIEVFNVIGLERSMAGLSLVGSVEVTCEPLITYEVFATSLGIDKLSMYPGKFDASSESDMFMLDFTIEYVGRNTDDLLSMWKDNVLAVMNARSQGVEVILFKIVGQRKMVMFLKSTAVAVDQLTFTLPLMQENGHNVNVKCRAIQDLGAYTKRITNA